MAVAPQEASRWTCIARWATVLLWTSSLCACRVRQTQSATPAPEAAASAYAGSAACAGCHVAETALWRGSDHERAMAVATPESVLGNFEGASFTSAGVTSRFFRRSGKYFVATAGPDGRPGEFEVAYTFGVRPLQQYLVPFPGGRLQALPIAWDTERKRWFDLESGRKVAPSDWLYWTRNGQNWNGMCASCHSTHLEKNLDPASGTYATKWSEISVGCEACHGPGSRHVAWAKSPAGARDDLAGLGLAVPTRDSASALRVEQCAPCHSRRAELADHDPTHRRLLDEALPSLLSEGVYFADGQQEDEVYTYASFLQSRMYAKGLACTDCHDPHAAKLRAPGDAVCVRCHNAAGAALRDGIDGSGLRRKDYNSPAHHFHRAGGAGSACVDCHAPPRTYMVVDPRHDHSFRIPRPDLTEATGSPNACNICHADRSSGWAAAAVARWYGPDRRHVRHYGEILAAARASRAEAGGALRSLVGDAAPAAIVRATALDLLGRYPGPESTAVLRAALAAEDPLLREAAAGVIDLPDPSERVAALAPLLSDPVRGVRHVALSTLAGTPREMLSPDRQAAFDRARAEYEEAMNRSLDFASSGLNLGNLDTKLGRPADAEHHYRTALAVDDLFFPAKLNLAVLLSGQGRNDEAEQLLRQVLQAYPANADAAYSLGLLLVEVGKREEAAEWLGKVVAAMPENGRAAYNLGLLLAQLGRVDQARAVLGRALDVEPGSFELLFALADLELKSGHPGAALALAERMVAARPEDPTGAQIRDVARRLLGQSSGQ